MARDRVTFRLDGEVTIAMLGDAIDRFQRVLEQLGTDHAAQVKWVVSSLESGSVEASALAVALDEPSQREIAAMVDDYLATARPLAKGTAEIAFASGGPQVHPL